MTALFDMSLRSLAEADGSDSRPAKDAAVARELLASADALIGTKGSGDDAGTCASLLRTIDGTVLRLLKDAPGSGVTADRGRLSELLEVAVALQIVRARLARRAHEEVLAPLNGVGAALGRLREITSSEEFYTRAAVELCTTCDFERLAIGRVDGPVIRPMRVHFTQDDDWALKVTEFLASHPIPFAGTGIVEAEAASAKRPLVVSNAKRHPRVFRPMIDVIQPRSYVVAPILLFDQVVGMLHADSFWTGRAADESDRDRLWAYAEGLGLALHQFLLRQRARQQARQLQRLAGFSDFVLPADSAFEAGPSDDHPSVSAGSPRPPRDSGPLREFERSLSRREREVLVLLAEGATNAVIAARLVITHETVKSHVRHILQKLGVSNRSEAAARYLSLSHAA